MVSLSLIMETWILRKKCLLFIAPINRFEKIYTENNQNEKAAYYYGLSLAWVYPFVSDNE